MAGSLCMTSGGSFKYSMTSSSRRVCGKKLGRNGLKPTLLKQPARKSCGPHRFGTVVAFSLRNTRIPRGFDARIQQRFFPMKVLICYYSTFGNVYKMANLVAEGVRQVAGAEPVVRTVPELIPATVIESRADMKAGRDLQKDIPLVAADDFREAGAIAFGTPTRFGNVSSQLKNQTGWQFSAARLKWSIMQRI